MLKTYLLTVNPAKGNELKIVLKSELQTSKNDVAEKIKRVLAELEGIHEMERGFSRQMVLSRLEFRLVRDINSKHKLGIEVQSL